MTTTSIATVTPQIPGRVLRLSIGALAANRRFGHAENQTTVIDWMKGKLRLAGKPYPASIQWLPAQGVDFATKDLVDAEEDFVKALQAVVAEDVETATRQANAGETLVITNPPAIPPTP